MGRKRGTLTTTIEKTNTTTNKQKLFYKTNSKIAKPTIQKSTKHEKKGNINE